MPSLVASLPCFLGNSAPTHWPLQKVPKVGLGLTQAPTSLKALATARGVTLSHSVPCPHRAGQLFPYPTKSACPFAGQLRTVWLTCTFQEQAGLSPWERRLQLAGEKPDKLCTPAIQFSQLSVGPAAEGDQWCFWSVWQTHVPVSSREKATVWAGGTLAWGSRVEASMCYELWAGHRSLFCLFLPQPLACLQAHSTALSTA